jgi:glycosyltransferase involved in cell wall biosynthesis
MVTPALESPVVDGGGGRRAGPIRVVFCISNLDIGGTELNAVRTAERLDRSRFAVQVVALQAAGPLRARYEEAGIPVRHTPIPNLFSARTVREGIRLAGWLRREAIDVFHSHDVYGNIFGAPWARVAGVPAVVESRRWWGSVPRKGLLTINRFTYRCAHCVTANSPSIARLLVDTDGISPERVRVIPNFVDESAFEPMPEADRRGFLTAFGVPSDGLVVGVVARLAEVKDHATLLQAVALLRPRWPKLWVLLVGDGESRLSLQAEVERLGLQDRTVFAGHQPHSPNLHSLFDVSVLCSVDEAFPNSVIEAMAAGRPVVATAVGGVPDAVVPGVTGLLVRPAAAEELASALDDVLASPDLGREMGAAGQARAREHHSEGTVVASLEALYEELTGPDA